MEPPNSTGMKPGSIFGRVLMMLSAGALILVLGWMGAGIFGTGLIAISNPRESWISVTLSISLGLTLMSGFPFLLLPLANCLRARRLRYVITTHRARLLRHGPVRSDLWIKLPLLANAPIFCAMAAVMFTGIFAMKVYGGLNT